MACTSSVFGLDGHKPHALFGHRFGDRLAIDEVVLVGFSVGFDELGRDEPHVVALLSQCSNLGSRQRRGRLFQGECGH